MIKIAFCDDDLSILNEIGGLLNLYCAERNKKHKCTAFQSPLELLAEFEKGARWDVLILDVLMPGENGISVAKEIRQYDDAVKIIFLTSSFDYAVESYTLGACFYQLKPIEEKEGFFRLMDSVAAQCEKEKRSSLILRSKSGIMRIELEKLEYCEVIGRTLLFHMENGKVQECNGSLDELCGRLAQHENFFRPHRSFLVNMEYIQNISGGMIIMDNLVQIPIPHGKCTEVKKRYLEYAFNGKRVFVV